MKKTIINDDLQKKYKVELISIWPTDYDDLGCTAVLYKDNVPVAKVLDSFDEFDLRYEFGDKDSELNEKLLEKSFKSLLLRNFDS